MSNKPYMLIGREAVSYYNGTSLYYSTDKGTTFTEIPLTLEVPTDGSSLEIVDVASSPSGKVILSVSYDDTETATSGVAIYEGTDGFTFELVDTYHSSLYSYTCNRLSYTGGYFVLVGKVTGYTDDGWLGYKQSGGGWSAIAFSSYELLDIVYGASLWGLLGDENMLLSSDIDASSWSTISLGFTGAKGICYKEGTEEAFVCVADGGVIATSVDCITWTEQTSGTTEDLYTVATNNETVIALGDNSTCLVSTEIATWVSGTALPTGGSYMGINYISPYFYTGGTDVMRSEDGFFWDTITVDEGTVLGAVAYYITIDLPYPASGLPVEGQQLVSQSRNVKGEVIGEKINRRLSKFNLTWNHLTEAEWVNILQLIDAFEVSLTFWDTPTSAVVTRKFYWGNSSAIPDKWDLTTESVAKPITFRDISCNLIDMGGDDL